jgi:hypothetical protein
MRQTGARCPRCGVRGVTARNVPVACLRVVDVLHLHQLPGPIGAVLTPPMLRDDALKILAIF